MYRDHLSGYCCYSVLILKTRRSGLSGSGMLLEDGTVHKVFQMSNFFWMNFDCDGK